MPIQYFNEARINVWIDFSTGMQYFFSFHFENPGNVACKTVLTAIMSIIITMHLIVNVQSIPIWF